jgi:outer membrane protein assembly factor BamB
MTGLWLAMVMACVFAVHAAADEPGADHGAVEPDQSTWLSGTMLQTNPDAESLLRRGEEYLAQQQYREALMLLQHVANRYPNVLCPVDARLYVPAAHRVEQHLVALPPEALALYRLSVDGEVLGLLGGYPNNVRAIEPLRIVAQQYFMSSHGDEAAEQLAALLIDAEQFHEAARWLGKLLRYRARWSGDASAGRRRERQVIRRLALCEYAMGRLDLAREQLDRLDETFGEPGRHAVMLEQLIVAAEKTDGESREEWAASAPGSLNAGREPGAMPAPDTADEPLTDALPRWSILWDQQNPLALPPPVDDQVMVIQSGYRQQSRPEVIQHWREHGWSPAMQLAFDGQRIYYKPHDALVCADAETGRILWRRDSQAGDDREKRNRRKLPVGARARDWPASAEEMSAFGDRISRSLTLTDGAVFHIDADLVSSLRHWVSLMGPPRANVRHEPPPANRLTACEAEDGSIRWRVGGDADPSHPLRDVRFLCPPVPAAGQLLVCYERNSEMHLASVLPKDGSVNWTRLICGVTAETLATWAPVAITADQGVAYVVGGQGVVMAVELAQGNPLWAARYAIGQEKERVDRPEWHGGRMTTTPGWESNAAFVRDGRLMVAPLDAACLYVLSAESGRLLDLVVVPQPKHVMGMIGRSLFATARGGLYRFDLVDAPAAGRGEDNLRKQLALAWKVPLVSTTGRGLLTESAMLFPSGQEIACYDHSGRLIGQADLQSALPDNDPLGNLYSDGRRLLIAGAQRVLVMVDGQRELKQINYRLARGGTAEDYLLRARLRQRLNDDAAAMEDLRRALAMIRQPKRAETIRRELYWALIEAAGDDDDQAALLLDEAESLAVNQREQRQVVLARGDGLADRANIRRALEQYLELPGSSGDPELMIRPEATDEWQVRSDLLARQRIEGLRAHDLLLVETVLSQQAAMHLEALRSVESELGRYLQWLRLARMCPDTDAAIAALGELVRLAPSIGRFEQAEVLLRDLAEDESERAAAAARLALGELYQRMEWSVAAAQQWREVVRGYDTILWKHGDQPITADDVARRRLSELPDGLPAEPDWSKMPRGPWRMVWGMAGRGYYQVKPVAAEGSQFLADHVLMLDRTRSRLLCRRLKDGRTAWQLPLDAEVAQKMVVTMNQLHFNGVMNRHVLVLCNSKQLEGYSLVTGRRLWSYPSRAALQFSEIPGHHVRRRIQAGVPSLMMGRHLLVWHSVGEDLLDRVEAFEAATGLLKWRRTFSGAAVDGVWVGDNVVRVVLANRQQVATLDAATGAVLSRITLDSPVSGSRMTWLNDGLLYHDGTNLRCVDLADGQVRWTRPAEARGRKFQVLDDTTAYLVQPHGRMVLIDLATGKARSTLSTDAVGPNVYDAALTAGGGRLVCLSHGDKATQLLSIIDLSTEEQVLRIDLGRNAGTRLSAQVLADAGELLPWAEREKRPDGGFTGMTRIVFYHRSDGRVEERYSLPTPQGGGRVRYVYGSPQILGNRLVVISAEGAMVFESAVDGQASSSPVELIEEDGD